VSLSLQRRLGGGAAALLRDAARGRGERAQVCVWMCVDVCASVCLCVRACVRACVRGLLKQAAREGEETLDEEVKEGALDAGGKEGRE
jgi:hypothetical protein